MIQNNYFEKIKFFLITYIKSNSIFNIRTFIISIINKNHFTFCNLIMLHATSALF